MSFYNSGWLNSSATFSGSGGQQGSGIGFGYGHGHNFHPTAFHQGQLPPRSTPACYLCAEQVSLAGLVPSSMTSELVTVPDLTAGLSLFYQNTQFQQSACPPCLALGKLSQFLTSLAVLENSIKQVKGHIESQVEAHQLQLITRAQDYEASISAKSAGSRSKIRKEEAKVTDSHDQCIAESVFGESQMSSSQSPNSVAEDSALDQPENYSPTNSKNTRKRAKSTSKSRAKKPKPRSRTSSRGDNLVDFVCGTCNKSFKTQARLDSHFLIHSGEKPFKCNECGKAFRHNPALFLHMKRHAGERKYKCDVCGHGFFTKWSLTEHEKYHTQEKPHKCPHCDFTFSRSSYLIQHVDGVHRDLAENPKARLKCPSCPKTFKYAYYLSRHEINSHRAEEKPVCCDLCGKKYADIPSYNRHKKDVHEGKRKKSNAPMRHQCVTCGRLFRTPSMLESHSRTHVSKEDRPKFPCSQCSKKYLCLKHLQHHQKQHEPSYNSKPRKNKISAKKIRLMKECRSKATKIVLTRVDAVNADEERRKRLLRRVKQRQQVYCEEENANETESAWHDEDEDEETTESELVVIEGFEPDGELYQNFKTDDQDQEDFEGANDEEEEVKVFVKPEPEDYIPGLV